LIELQGLPEPRRAASPQAGATDADPRLAGIAAHHVLELWPLERWGEPPDLAALGQLLERAGVPAASSVGQQTLAGLARFLGGSYAARVKRDAVRVQRELELTVTLRGAPTPPKKPAGKQNPAQLELFAAPAPSRAAPEAEPALVVKATLDLLVELRDGSLHVIDYKRSRGGDDARARYGPQLALYRSVVEQTFGKIPRVGLINLMGDSDEPEWLSPQALDPAALAREFLAARSRDAWSSVAEPRCRAVRCGFVTSCHFNASS
jgi:ATP-dependent exoDNAse (exonuclease V) beta subunit